MWKAYEIPAIKFLMQTKAHPLGYQGIEIGWSREDALNVIDLLDGTDIGILGGDVWEARNGEMVPALENWYCDPAVSESLPHFAVRSQAKAKKYIENYPESGLTLYTIVFNI